MVDYDKTFEFDYLMQVDQESRENGSTLNKNVSYFHRRIYNSGELGNVIFWENIP